MQHEIRDVTKSLDGTESDSLESQPLITQETFPDETTQLSNITKELPRIAKSLFNGEKSLYTLLYRCTAFQETMLKVQAEYSDYLDMEDSPFKKKHPDKINRMVQRIRVMIWQEYEQAIYSNRNMITQNIYAGTCDRDTFSRMIADPIKVAFLMRPPADYVAVLKEAHAAGLDKLREIFDAKIIDEDGWLNPKAADIVLKAYALLDARLKGAVIQRVDQRVLNAKVNISTDGNITPALTDMDVLELELQKAREKIAQYTKLPKHPSMGEITLTLKEIKREQE